MNGMTLYVSKPASPKQGDAYYEKNIEAVVVFNGTNWCAVSNKVIDDPEIIKLKDELENIKDYLKYKNVDTNDLDDFINSKKVIKKLIGE